MADDILKVRMLGGFSMQYGGKELILDRNSVSKMTQLLQLLLININDGISKTGLLDALYGRDDVENRNGSLNNTIFRLRKQLKAAGLPESTYVKNHGGICRWDTQVPVEVDCRIFEDIIESVQNETDEQKIIDAYLQACDTYTGEFLPNMIGEDWVSVKNIYYRNLYFDCVERLCRLLFEQEQYEKVYSVSSKAASIYPFEDWQIWMIDSLTSMSRYKEAMEVYEETTRLYFDELSLPPSPEMLKRVNDLGQRISQASGAIGDIKKRLQEREKASGAYYCTFPSFVDIYHVICRLMERSGVSVYIMLCTLKELRDTRNDTTRNAEGALALHSAIRTTLRRGDFYTRYNSAQYLIMLSGINQENCRKVSERIDGLFRRSLKSKDFEVDYYVASVAELRPGLFTEGQKFENSEKAWKD